MKKILFIFFTALFAVLVYSYNLSGISFWIDEIQTTTYAQQSFSEMIRLVSHKEACPPLYYIILYLAHLLGADSELTLRIPSLLLSFASILTIYFLAKELYGEKEGIISALLLAISPLFIICARDARLYSFFILVNIALSLSFLKAMKNKSFKGWIVYTLLLSLSFYAHYFSAFLAISQFVYLCAYLFLKRGKNDVEVRNPQKLFINFFTSGFIAVLLFLPWVSHLLTQIINKHEHFAGLSLLQKIKDVMSMTFFWFGGGEFFSVILIFIFIIFGIFMSFKKLDSLFFLLINIAVPILFISFYFISINWIFQERYSSFLISSFIIICSRGISEISIKFSEIIKKKISNINISKTSGVTSAFIIIICFSAFFNINRNILVLQKENWGDTANIIQSVYRENDFVTGLPPWTLWCISKYGAFNKGEKQVEKTNNVSRIYAVFPHGNSPPPILKKLCKGDFKLLSSFPGWNPINVWEGEFLYSPLVINFSEGSSEKRAYKGNYGTDLEFKLSKNTKRITAESDTVNLSGFDSIIISGRATVSHYSIRPVMEASFLNADNKLIKKTIINPMAFLTGDFTYFGWYREIIDLRSDISSLKLSFTISGNINKNEYCRFKDLKIFGRPLDSKDS